VLGLPRPWEKRIQTNGQGLVVGVVRAMCLELTWHIALTDATFWGFRDDNDIPNSQLGFSGGMMRTGHGA
jgi:hypothetical protein